MSRSLGRRQCIFIYTIYIQHDDRFSVIIIATLHIAIYIDKYICTMFIASRCRLILVNILLANSAGTLRAVTFACVYKCIRLELKIHIYRRGKPYIREYKYLSPRKIYIRRIENTGLVYF